MTQAALERYRKRLSRQSQLASGLVSRSLDAYFAQNPGGSTADARAFAVELLKTSLPNFCDAAGTLAADFFDEMMAAENIDASGELYDTTDWSIVEDKVRYFAGKLNGGDVAAFKRDVVDSTRFFVMRSAYDNMVENCKAGNVRYARVPSGFETCAFCFMLSSRGFVYHSEMTARGLHGYHAHCDCIIVPGAKGRTRIDGYDPQTMADNWERCAQTAGTHDPRAVMREVETRDWHWLYTGEAPNVTFEDDDVKKKVLDENPHELRTAERLARCGIDARFIRDYREIRDQEGVRRRIGLPDFANGVEIKTPMSSRNPFGAVDNYLENCSGKEQLKRIIIDNTESCFTDSELREAMETVNRDYGFEHITYLGKDGELHNI